MAISPMGLSRRMSCAYGSSCGGQLRSSHPGGGEPAMGPPPPAGAARAAVSAIACTGAIVGSGRGVSLPPQCMASFTSPAVGLAEWPSGRVAICGTPARLFGNVDCLLLQSAQYILAEYKNFRNRPLHKHVVSRYVHGQRHAFKTQMVHMTVLRGPGSPSRWPVTRSVPVEMLESYNCSSKQKIPAARHIESCAAHLPLHTCLSSSS